MTAITVRAAPGAGDAPRVGTGAVASDGQAAADPTRRRQLGAAILAALAFALLVGYVVSPWLRGQVAESFSHRPTPFTALFFTDHTMLPRDLSRAGPLPFSFTITNHEGHQVDYRYRVIGISPNGPQTAAEASAVVPNGKSVVQTVDFVPARPHTAYTVTVQLVGRPELIHFTATS